MNETIACPGSLFIQGLLEAKGHMQRVQTEWILDQGLIYCFGEEVMQLP